MNCFKSKSMAGILIFVLTLSLKGVAANSNYFTDTVKLTPSNQTAFNAIVDDLNHWIGKKAESDKLKSDIESFIKSAPNFIPIYIEKVRYDLKEGYRSMADAIALNKAALNSLEGLELKAPNYGPIAVLKAHTLTNLQQYNLAQQALDNAARLDAKTVWYHLNLATLRLSTGTVEKAVNEVYTALSAPVLKLNELNTALLILSNNSRYINPDIDLVNLVFNQLTDQDDRLQLARLLARNYSGKRMVLALADSIINKQQEEQPDCQRCILEKANLILVAGATSLRDNVTYFTESAQTQAQELLVTLKGGDVMQDRVYDHLINIAFSEKDFAEVSALIDEGRSMGLDEIMLGKQHALLLYKQGNFEAAKDELEQLSTKDESILNERLLSTIYGKSGNYEKLEEFHLNQIAQMPDVAWAYGNYVTFLITKKKDSKKAIEYGEKGLALMDYPLLRDYLGLAYHIEGSKFMFETGESYIDTRKLAADYFTKSLELNRRDYSKDTYCIQCTSMDVVKKIIELANKPPKKEKFNYMNVIKIISISLLIGLIVFKFFKSRKST